jgi:hypothetical protein
MSNDEAHAGEGDVAPPPEEGIVPARVGFYVSKVDHQVLLQFEMAVDFLAMDGAEAIQLGKALMERGHRALKDAKGRARKSGGRIIRS